MRWILLLLVTALCGCAAADRGARVTGASAQVAEQVRDIETRLEAKIAENLQVKLAEHVKVAEQLRAELSTTLEAKINAQVNARVKVASAEVRQQIEGGFKGQQNVGALSGGAIYVLVLAAIVVLAILSVVALVLWWLLRGKSALLSAVTNGVASAKVSNRDAVEPVLKAIAKYAEKGGVASKLDRFLTSSGLLK